LSIDYKKSAWITPKGKWISIDILHAWSVYYNPKSYGLTYKQVSPAVEEMNPRGTEEINSEHIYGLLIPKGWVRYGSMRTPGKYYFEVQKLTDSRVQDILYDWAINIDLPVSSKGVLVTERIDFFTTRFSLHELQNYKFDPEFD